MAEESKSPMELVLVDEHVVCTFCKNHIPAMVEIESVVHGRLYMCQFCCKEMLDAFERPSGGESDG